MAGRDEFTYTKPIVGVPLGTAPNVLNKSFTITADIEVADGGGNGMLVTEGGRFGGWGFYLLKGKPVFVYDLLDLARPKVEGGAALTPGRHTVEFAFKYDGPGLGKGGTGTITVDGVEAGRGTFPHTIPFALEASETFDVGSDTGTGVDDADYQTPFAFDGKLNGLTLKLLPAGCIAKAKERGVHFGRKLTLTPERIAEIKALRLGGSTVPNIMRHMGLSKASVYRALRMVSSQHDEEPLVRSETAFAVA